VGAGASAHAGAFLGEGGVAQVVQAVLDCPVPRIKSARWADGLGEGEAGDRRSSRSATLVLARDCGREWVGFAGYRSGPAAKSGPAADRRYGREWAVPCSPNTVSVTVGAA
jgi:hypothetical protein